MPDTITKNWIENIIQELTKLGDLKGEKMLESCGRACSCFMETDKKAIEIREKIGDKDNCDLLIQTFMDEVFQQSKLYKVDNSYMLEYTYAACACPMVKENQIKNAFLCNCTKGHTKHVFETLLNRKVDVTIQKSILRGDSCCLQKIDVK